MIAPEDYTWILEAFSDPEQISKVSKETDKPAGLLQASFAVHAIKRLGTTRTGYLNWQKYIRKAQSRASWETSLQMLLQEWSADDRFIEAKRRSASNTKPSAVMIKDGANIDVAELLITFWTLGNIEELRSLLNPSVQGLSLECAFNLQHSLTARFFFGYFLSYQGEPQQANNHAITLFEFAEQFRKKEDSSASDLALFLGLSLWAHNQFSIGNQIEGLLCAIAALDFGCEIVEYDWYMCNVLLPIIRNWIIQTNNKSDYLDASAVSLWSTSGSSENRHDKVRLAAASGNWTRVIELTKSHLSTETAPLLLASELSYCLSALMKENRLAEAYDLVIEFQDPLRIGLHQFPGDLVRFAPLLTEIFMMYGFRIRDLSIVELGLAWNVRVLEVANSLYNSCDHLDERLNIAELRKKVALMQLDLIVTRELLRTGSSAITSKAVVDELFSVMQYTASSTFLEGLQIKGPVDESLEVLLGQYRQNMELYSKLSTEVSAQVAARQALANEMNRQREILIQKHPHYRTLKSLNHVNLSTLTQFLPEDAAFMQYCMSDKFLYTLYLDQRSVSFWWRPRDTALEAEASVAHQRLQAYDDKVSRNTSEYNTLADTISQEYFEFLGKFAIKIKTLYYCAPTSDSIWPFSLLRFDGTWFIERVEEVSRFRHPAAVTTWKSAYVHDGNAAAWIFGKESNPAIIACRKWAKKNLFYRKAGRWCLNPDQPKEDSTKCNLAKHNEISVIMGHGIHDTSNPYSGALLIEGALGPISVDELEEITNRSNHIILFSCSGGINAEAGDVGGGTFLAALANFQRSFILCTWDVPTRPGLSHIRCLFKALRSSQLTMGEALVRAQRRMATELSLHPVCWAGFEYWAE